jgi:hypothetical protein
MYKAIGINYEKFKIPNNKIGRKLGKNALVGVGDWLQYAYK